MDQTIDILMITYNRPQYTEIALSRLLETCDEKMNVWVWHNGTHNATLQVVKSMQGHPNFKYFHHSVENMKLTEPTNWLWRNSDSDYVSKVDDDCLMPKGWGDKLRTAHEDNPEFGVVGCWRFPSEDFLPEVAAEKIIEYKNGHKIMRNCWVEGSGYLMKRDCIEKMGLLGQKGLFLKFEQSFTHYCVQLEKEAGFINGWYYPFLYQEHFDDPRTKHTNLKNDQDMEKWAPLSAINNGVTTIDDWRLFLEKEARFLQECPYEYKYYTGWRSFLKRIKARL